MSNLTFNKQKHIIILGASFSTGNLGVSALAWSIIKLVKQQWPDAKVTIIRNGWTPGKSTFTLDGKKQTIKTWPVQYRLNILTKNHIIRLITGTVIYRYLPRLRKRFAGSDSTLKTLLNSDIFFDISGGDSFSDLYGLSRIFRDYLLKRTCQLTGKPLILLPQTYGPYSSFIAKTISRTIFLNSHTVFARDRKSLNIVNQITDQSTTAKLCPDLAFIMSPQRPENKIINYLERQKATKETIIGLNISGLLYYGGYTKDNMFSLTCDYPALIQDIILLFTGFTNHHIVLVPHVFPSQNFKVEDDLAASREIISNLSKTVSDKTIILEKGYNQNEAKYYISLCDFFIGSRMHSTIAALSQCIPSIGMAYSDKFSGVFNTAGVLNHVIDLRYQTNKEIISRVKELYFLRKKTIKVLNTTIPKIKKDVNTLLSSFTI